MGSKNTIRKIYENYDNIQKSIVNQLLLEAPEHYSTTGTYRETVWKSLFEKIIPKKFCIDQGVFIIDSNGNKSKEVDLAIFDEQYTPYIFNYGEIKFIPIEAVSVVIQCKSNCLTKKILKEWTDSVDRMVTSSRSIARVMPGIIDNSIKKAKSQNSTRPVKILCCISEEKNLSDSIKSMFDICIYADKTEGILKKIIPCENDKYYEWYLKLNHSELYKNGKKDSNLIIQNGKDIDKKLSDIKVTNCEGKENVLLSLIFQLNQLLMLINNPMLFPHEAYAEMFKLDR